MRYLMLEVPDADDLSAFSAYRYTDVTPVVRRAIDEEDAALGMFEFRLAWFEGWSS